MTRQEEISGSTRAACLEHQRGQAFLYRARNVSQAHQSPLFQLYRLRMEALASRHFARAGEHLRRAQAQAFDVRRRVPGQDEYARCGHQHPTERAAQECMRQPFGGKPYGMVRPLGAPDFDELHTPEDQALMEWYQDLRLLRATAIARKQPPVRYTLMELAKAGATLCYGACANEAPVEVGLCFECHQRIHQEAQRQQHRGQLSMF